MPAAKKQGSLTVTRKIGQAIYIDVPASLGPTLIRVIVTSFKGENTRVNVTAPLEVKIMREEALNNGNY